jgi:uncharacterized protein (TIGR04255 family)
MAEIVLSSPFGTEQIEDVPLGRSPLARALAQIRFPKLVSMSEQNIEATLAKTIDALGEEYPILNKERELQFALGPDGVQQAEGAWLWRLQSHDESWRVSLGEAFVSLEAKEYTSRSDFINRLNFVLHIVAETIKPPFAERIGVRYTNVIDDPSLLLRLHELVRPEVLGGFAVPRPQGVALAHMMSQSLYEVRDRKLNVRWGYLPAGALVDPGLAPSEAVSWMLDLDSFAEGRWKFNDEVLGEIAEELAHGAYRYFRWVVTEQFLTAFGGHP